MNKHKGHFRVLEARLAPRDQDLAMGLLFQAGLTTVLTERTRKDLVLQAQLPAGDSGAPARVRAAERVAEKPVFRMLKVRRIARGGWARNYQRHLKPFALVAGTDGVSPLWIDPRGNVPRRLLKGGALTIKASLAFGTGTHASTQLAAHFLGATLSQIHKARVLDVGCGTSILAMSAARWGAKRVTAVDNDPEALKISRENLKANRVGGVVLRASLPEKRARFDVVVANITAPVLKELREALTKRIAPGGYLILSGLLYRDVPAVRRCYRALRLLGRKNRGGWSALLLRRKASS